MVTVTIEGKDYNFVFNANTSELFYQVFNEDLFDITLKMKEDNTLIMKRNRLQKLAFIANMQSKKPIRELAGRLSLVQYFEWSEQFAGGTFSMNTNDLTNEASETILGVTSEALETIEGITDGLDSTLLIVTTCDVFSDIHIIEACTHSLEIEELL